MNDSKRKKDVIANESPLWRGCVEVHCASLDGLKNLRNFLFKIWNISPGEALHIINAGIEWLDNGTVYKNMPLRSLELIRRK